MRHGSYLPLVIVAATCAWWPSPAALAAPSLRVRATTAIRVQVRASDRETHIDGTLRDDVGAAIAGKALHVTFAPALVGLDANLDVRTGDAGDFAMTLPGTTERVIVRVSYDGDDYYDRSETTAELDASRADVRLEISVNGGSSFVADGRPVACEVRAASPAGAQALTVELADELGRVLTRGATDASGVLRVNLDSRHTGAPGLGKLVATTQQDATRAAARAELAIVRRLETRLQLTAALAAQSADHPSIVVRGELRDTLGDARSLAHKAITLFADDERVATLLTDAHGAFEHAFTPSDELRQRRELMLSARFEPDAPWLGASRSAAARIELPSRAVPSAAWLVGPVALSCCLFAWLLLRTRSRGSAATEARTRSPGVRPGLAKRRGTRTSLQVDGRIEDAFTGMPLTQASVELVDAREHVASAPQPVEGVFRTDLPRGEYTLIASAPGYAGVRAHVSVPHAGEASAMRIALASLRELALDAHQPLAQRVLAGKHGASNATVRDTSRATAQQLEPLTQLVERVAYARDTPTTRDLHDVQSGVDAALAELDGKAPAVASAGAPNAPDWER